MRFSVLLLLLPTVCSIQANNYGIVMNYYPRGTDTDGSSTGTLYIKRSAQDCIDHINSTFADGVILLSKVDEETSGEWCQTEGFITKHFSRNASFSIAFSGVNWISGIKNNITTFKAVTLVDLRIRSDIAKANTSPQTTIIPALRVPSNCQRNFSLLMFDPDGDVVKCRYGNTPSECDPCDPPSVLSLSQSSCTLSFSVTNRSNEGPYVVQLLMEDFPTKTINLAETNSTQMLKRNISNAISKIPIQFVLRVDPAVPSCTEGLFLPKFLLPTPAHRAQLYTIVSQALEISISAEALNSMISELLFSGPLNVHENKTGRGEFTLTWTPSETEAGQSHPFCFVVEALYNGTKYHSELRCVIVNVGNETLVTTPQTTTVDNTLATTPEATISTSTLITTPTATPKSTTPASTSVYISALTIKISSLVDLSQIDKDAFLNQIKQLLVKNGLPADIVLHLISRN